ncbi:hypothetical protein [Dysgonomonas macrotermitis]|uniref:Fimbrillin-A associated anchor protein Mfa1 and Mfa2 n=1 Tax=Dysgonomonas macrotermitis TaxID=1346286 RepID=A0A1M5JMW2_9BACT|nr:hypothetical protein [Dysgonomonas macrotermitis]SHG41580.1 hypothetical protein SAMN05444362_1267 [Dysgonomonas macrotermitis]
MKTIFKTMIPLICFTCCTLMASCNLIDFSEDCTYYGDVEIKPDLSALTVGEEKPALTDIYLLSPQHNYMYGITSDTLVTGIRAASYRVLACNAYGLQNIDFSGMDCPETAQAELSAFEKDGRLYTVQAPVLYAANADLTVIPFERVVCEPALKPATRRIDIDFVVVGNTDMGVSAVSGELSGIAYKYSFKRSDALESDAWLAFDTQRNVEKDNVFSSTLNVFGVNPDKQGTGRIDNLLDIAVQTSDGNRYRESIALTDVFSGFTTRIIHITIQIRLGLMGMEAEVAGWDVSDGGVIEL